MNELNMKIQIRNINESFYFVSGQNLRTETLKSLVDFLDTALY